MTDTLEIEPKVIPYGINSDGVPIPLALSGIPNVHSPNDGSDISPGGQPQVVLSSNYVWSGSNWEVETGNAEIDLIASTSTGSNAASAVQQNNNSRGLHVMIDVTAVTGGSTITPSIQGLDNTSNQFYDLLIGLPINAIGLTIIKLYPGITGSPNISANDILPRNWRVFVENTGGGSYTFSVGANLVI